MSPGRRLLVHAVAATTGGGASRVRELAATLPRLCPDDELLFVVRGGLDAVVRQTAPAARTLKPSAPAARMPLRLAWEQALLPRAATREFSPDVVLAPFNVAPLRWPGRSPATVAIVSNLAPYSPEVRSLYRGRELLRLKLLKALTDRTLRRADRVLLLSEQAIDLIGPRLLADKARLIPMAPPAVTAAEPAKRPDQPYFVVVGDLLRYKGIEVLIAALETIPPKERPTVVLVGRPVDRPYARRLRRAAAAAGVAEQLRYAGSVPQAEVLGLMRASMGCVVPSRFENPSRVPVEAMAAGAPVVASDIPPFRSTCGDAAAFFRLDRPAELADRLRELASDSSYREEMVRRGAARLADLDAGSATERIVTTIDELSPGSRDPVGSRR